MALVQKLVECIHRKRTYGKFRIGENDFETYVSSMPEKFTTQAILL